MSVQNVKRRRRNIDQHSSHWVNCSVWCCLTNVHNNSQLILIPQGKYALKYILYTSQKESGPHLPQKIFGLSLFPIASQMAVLQKISTLGQLFVKTTWPNYRKLFTKASLFKLQENSKERVRELQHTLKWWKKRTSFPCDDPSSARLHHQCLAESSRSRP